MTASQSTTEDADPKTGPQPAKKRPSRAKATMRNPVVSTRRLLDINDLCDLMRCNERTIDRMIADGDFPRAMPLREEGAREVRRWTLEQYERWAARRQKKAEEAIQ